jgi:hypothetical protein
MDSQIIFVPFLTKQKFAASIGVTEDVVTTWIKKDYVKLFHIGRRALIDLRQWDSAAKAAVKK